MHGQAALLGSSLPTSGHLPSLPRSLRRRALLRCHPPPNMHKMTELSTTAAELGFELDTSGAGGWV